MGIGRTLKGQEMGQELWFAIAVIALAMAAYIAYWLMTKITESIEGGKNKSPQGVVKHDWLPTGRVDFATRLNGSNDQNKEQPAEFKLLVEERRIVESLAGNENLEIQWRLATLSEARAVVSHYHKYLSENMLIKSTPELSAPTGATRIEYRPHSSNGSSETVSQSAYSRKPQGFAYSEPNSYAA
jgi:hypothetical protein